MTYKPETAEQWRAEAGVFSRALRGLADRLDTLVTTGASREEFLTLANEVQDLSFEMDNALDQFPTELA